MAYNHNTIDTLEINNVNDEDKQGLNEQTFSQNSPLPSAQTGPRLVLTAPKRDPQTTGQRSPSNRPKNILSSQMFDKLHSSRDKQSKAKQNL